jgi:hypothetical protein
VAVAETNGHGHVARHRGDRGRRGDRHEDDLEEPYGVGLEPAVLLGARARLTTHTRPGCFSAFQCPSSCHTPVCSKPARFLTHYDRPREFLGSAVPSTLREVFTDRNQVRSSHILCHEGIFVRERFSRYQEIRDRPLRVSEYKTPFCGLQNSSRGEWYSAGRTD